MKHKVQARNRDADVAEWAWSDTYREHAKVVERLDLWDSPVCRIWLPNRDAIVLVPASDVTPITGSSVQNNPPALEPKQFLVLSNRQSLW